MNKISQRLLLMPREVFKDKDPKCLANFFGQLSMLLDKVDNDKDVKDCSQEVDLIKRKIISTKNQSVKEFHSSTLYRIENPNSNFLIFNN